MPRGRKPLGKQAMTSTERVHRSRLARPRTEELHRALAQVLRCGVAEGWIPEADARDALLAELEGMRVGPERRHLAEAERETLADRLLGESI